MSIKPGTKETDRIPGSDYLRSRHPAFVGICASDREQRRWEETLLATAEALETSALRARIAHLLTHGGHVDRGTMARAGISADMDPDKVLDVIVRDLPQDLAQRAILPPDSRVKT